MFALVVASTTLQSQLPMGFTLPLTRLAFKHLKPLSCQRLGPPTTLTTWVSTFYVRLTNSLECQDAILTWTLTKLYNEAPPQTFVELCPNHEAPPWAPTNKGHGITSCHEAPPRNHRGITSWPMRHHHEISHRDSCNYILNHTKIMSPTKYKVILRTNFIQTFITHHQFVFHTKIIPRS